MPTKRSRSYPYYSLEEALKLSRMIYEVGGNGMAPVESILSKMNIKSKQNKRYGYLTSSARQYGLIENIKGGFKVKQLAISILYPASDNDPNVSIGKIKAATNPELYREILSQYNGSILPKDEFLINNFIQKGILNNVAEIAVQAFLNTAVFAGILEEGGRVVINEKYFEPDVNIKKSQVIKPNEKRKADKTLSKLIYDSSINEKSQNGISQIKEFKDINNVFNLEIPLNSGKKATISIPKDVTEEEINLIKNFIDAIKPND